MRECHGDRMEKLRMFLGGRDDAFGRHGGRGGGRHSHRHDGRDGEGGMLRRILGHGDLRYVILALLEEKPSHGYELIKALEEKSAGQYVPSPGVIYPTLTFLEEGGYATATSQDNKKLYTITQAGKTLLDENRDFVLAIFERLSTVGEKMSRLRDWFGKEESEASSRREGRHSLRHVMHELKAELFAKMPMSKEQLTQLTTIIERTIADIRNIK